MLSHPHLNRRRTQLSSTPAEFGEAAVRAGRDPSPTLRPGSLTASRSKFGGAQVHVHVSRSFEGSASLLHSLSSILFIASPSLSQACLDVLLFSRDSFCSVPLPLLLLLPTLLVWFRNSEIEASCSSSSSFFTLRDLHVSPAPSSSQHSV